MKGFARWLWKDGRAPAHPLAHLATSNPDADRRRRRRALTPQEAARLVAAAGAGGVVMGLDGPSRAILYELTIGTGFRSEELRSLTPERLDLAGGRPTATVLACYSKNGKEAA
jgi:integrase